MILWVIAACSMFALVDVEGRYIAPFVVLFWIALYDAVSAGLAPSSGSMRRLVFAAAALWILVPVLLRIRAEAAQAGESQSQVAVANELARLGLHPGDEIATAGYPFAAYYARLDRLHMIATIGYRGTDSAYDTSELWSLDNSQFHTLQDQLRSDGAKAIVSSEPCGTAPPGSDWAIHPRHELLRGCLQIAGSHDPA